MISLDPDNSSLPKGSKMQINFSKEEYRPFIDEFEDETFWTELTDRLADRDMLRILGDKKILKMTPEERFMTHHDFEEKYEEEFEEHGIERLEIRD